jgi:hypothetical protein
MGEYQRTITIEPWSTNPSGRIDFDPVAVEGKAPPFQLPSWWPWAVAAIAIGGLWYLTREKGRGPLGGTG